MGTDRAGESNGGSELRVDHNSGPHYLRPTISTSVPSNLIFVDCESYRERLPKDRGEIQRFRLGVAIGVRREKGRVARRTIFKFDDTREFWAWAMGRTSPKRPMWIYAHNLAADCTWLGTWDMVDSGKLRFNEPCPSCGRMAKGKCKSHSVFRGACIISDPPVILAVKCDKGVIRMVDTINYWRTSVAALGDGIGLPKLPLPAQTAPQEDWFQYCQRDTEIIEQSVCQLMDKWEADDCGHWSTTAAGLGFAAFRRIAPEKQILINHSEPQISLSRAAYYGGQAEAYYLGEMKQKIYLYDVRSFYPRIMLDHWFPVEFMKMGKDLDPQSVKRKMQFHCCVARCTVRTMFDGYPKRLLDLDKHGKTKVAEYLDGQIVFGEPRLAFPTGEYQTCLAGPELARAIENRELVKIHEIAWYRSAKVFSNFIRIWYDRRPELVTPETFAQDLLCKTVMNSMSGRFGQRKRQWTDMPMLAAMTRWGQWIDVNAATGKVHKMRAIAGHVQELEESGEARHSFPAISAYITAYGREHMLWLRSHCPPQSVLYQDTDSLMCLQPASNNLQHYGLIGNGQIGYLRLVGTSESCHIHAVKDYEFGGKAVVAGVKPDAKRIASGRWKQDEWESLPSILSRLPDGSVRVRSVRVNLSRDRVGRIPTESGWTVAPHLGES